MYLFLNVKKIVFWAKKKKLKIVLSKFSNNFWSTSECILNVVFENNSNKYSEYLFNRFETK